MRCRHRGRERSRAGQRIRLNRKTTDIGSLTSAMLQPWHLGLLPTHEIPRPCAVFKYNGRSSATAGNCAFIEALDYGKLRQQRLCGGTNAKARTAANIGGR